MSKATTKATYALLAYCAFGAVARGQSPVPPSNGSLAYHVSHRQFDAGSGDFDYMTFDQDLGRLYVTRDGGAEVYDTRHPELAYIASIPAIPGRLVDKVVLVPTRNLGFTSNGEGASTTIFDTGSLRMKGTFPLGEDSDAALYDEVTGHAFFFSPTAKEAVVYDLGSHSVLAHVPLGSAPEFAVDDGAGHIYVNLPDTSMIAKIDARSKTVVASFTVDPSCGFNASLDIDLADRLLFAGCFNGVLDVIDIGTEKTVSTFQTGAVPDAVVFDPFRKLLFVSSVAHVISVIQVVSPATQVLSQSIPVGSGTRTIAEDYRTGKVYSMSVKYGPPLVKGGFPSPIPDTVFIDTISP